MDRHERKRLLKHASLGNINGMESFLDIFTTLVRLPYVYCRRSIVKRGKLIGRLCTFAESAAIGKDAENEQFDGYLYSVYGSLGGNVAYLREVCGETNYLAEVRAAPLIVQSVRFDPNENPTYGPKATWAREVLQSCAKAIAEGIREPDLNEPSPKDVQRALEDYRMFTEAEIAALVAEERKR